MKIYNTVVGKIVYLFKPPPGGADLEDLSFAAGAADLVADGKAVSTQGVVTVLKEVTK